MGHLRPNILAKSRIFTAWIPLKSFHRASINNPDPSCFSTNGTRISLWWFGFEALQQWTVWKNASYCFLWLVISGLIFFSPVRFKPGLILVPHTNLSGLTVSSKLAKEAATHTGKTIILARIGWVGIKTHIEQFVQKIQAGVEDAAKESLRLGQRVGVSWDGRRHYPPPPNSVQLGARS